MTKSTFQKHQTSASPRLCARNMFLILLLSLALSLTSCSTTQTGPVTVQITESPTESTRFRSPERQRDLWFAPRATSDEVLEHEQVVTFVEKPGSWIQPTSLEPHAVQDPQLQNQTGDYESSVITRQKEMLTEREGQIKTLQEKLELMQKQSMEVFQSKESEIQAMQQNLKLNQKQAADLIQKLSELQKAEEQRKVEAAQPKKKKWSLW